MHVDFFFSIIRQWYIACEYHEAVVYYIRVLWRSGILHTKYGIIFFEYCYRLETVAIDTDETRGKIFCLIGFMCGAARLLHCWVRVG